MQGTTTAPPRAVAVRRAVPGDEGAIRSLFGALHAFNAALEPRFALATGWEAVLNDQLTDERGAGRRVILLAWDGTEPVGLAMLAAHTDSPLFGHRHWAELTALYVVPGARGSGVADRLLASGLTWARTRGDDEVRLYVTSSNHRARRFYAAAGFRPIQEIWSIDLAPALAAETPTTAEAREAA